MEVGGLMSEIGKSRYHSNVFPNLGFRTSYFRLRASFLTQHRPSAAAYSYNENPLLPLIVLLKAL